MLGRSGIHSDRRALGIAVVWAGNQSEEQVGAGNYDTRLGIFVSYG